MNTVKNTDFSKDLSAVPRPYEQLTYLQRSYIDWKAVGGLVLSEDGELKKWKLADLADACRCSASSFQNVSNLPNFWDLVDERRRALNGQSRLAKVHNTFYLKAVGGHPTLLPIWLANYDNTFRMPMQQVKHEASDDLMGLFGRAKKPEAIEAEIVDVTDKTD